MPLSFQTYQNSDIPQKCHPDKILPVNFHRCLKSLPMPDNLYNRLPRYLSVFRKGCMFRLIPEQVRVLRSYQPVTLKTGHPNLRSYHGCIHLLLYIRQVRWKSLYPRFHRHSGLRSHAQISVQVRSGWPFLHRLSNNHLCRSHGLFLLRMYVPEHK